jgi:peptide deformylase
MSITNFDIINRSPKIIVYPDPILLSKADLVKNLNEKTENIFKQMDKAMEINNGIGLAAPQIGVPLRMITVKRVNWIYQLVNPKISWKMGNTINFEGCLSLPGEVWQIERAAEVVVEGIDHNGKDFAILVDGLLGRIFQHEIDHLDGILIRDKANASYIGKEANAHAT